MAKLIFLVIAAVCIGVCAAAAVNDEFGYPDAGIIYHQDCIMEVKIFNLIQVSSLLKRRPRCIKIIIMMHQ